MTTQAALSALTLEDIVTGASYADLDASPLQRAICRVARGAAVDDLIDADACEQHFGTPELRTGHLPTLMVLIAGVRGGKSFLAACAAIHAALTAYLDGLKLHEVPRAVIVAPTVDVARATFVLLVGILQSSPILSRFIVGEPTADTVVVQRPDGRRVEVVVVAAHRGGLSVRNRWLCFCCIEESAQFGQEIAGAVVNVENLERAAVTRLLPGCQAWIVTSPFGPIGRAFELYKKHFGKPGRTVVVHAPTRALNPAFPQEQIDAVAAEDPDTAAREYGAEWLDAESSYYSSVAIDRATRAEPLIRPGRATVAAMDPATRGNSWTLAVGWLEVTKAEPWHAPPAERTKPERGRVIIGGCWQWQGSKAQPLSPRAVLGQIATVLRPYGVTRIRVDSWSFDAMQDHARAVGLSLVEQPAGERELPYQRLRTLLNNNDIELPPDPIVRADLVSVKQRVSSAGAKAILPTSANGRHADFVPSIALVAAHAERRSSVNWGQTFRFVAAHDPLPRKDQHGHYW